MIHKETSVQKRKTNNSKKTGFAAKVVMVRKFAEQCDYDPRHSEQVRKLAELLFRKLSKIHGFGAQEKFLLTAAAVLHDIGWSQGKKAHHKNAMRMILSDNTMLLDSTDLKMIALIARYHRKALPKPEHAVYGELSGGQQKSVRLLAGILRIADGLDRTQAAVVQDVNVRIKGDIAEFQCTARCDASAELWAADKKADLFTAAYGLKPRFSQNC